MTDPLPTAGTPFGREIFPYLLLDWIGILIAMYFFLGDSNPELIQDMGLPILMQGEKAYLFGVMSIMVFTMPMVLYILRRAKERKSGT